MSEIARLHATFARSPGARRALWILVLLHMIVLFAHLIAPHPSDEESRAHAWAPPSRIHLGPWLVPYVHPVSATFDQSQRRVWTEDTAVRAPLRLLTDGRLISTDPIPGARLLPLGADGRGRCILSRALHAGQISLTTGLLGTALSTLLALLVGGLAGFVGGRTDAFLMRFCEIVMLIPGFYLLMLLRTALPLEWDSRLVHVSIVVVLAAVGWAGLARIVRGMILAVRSADHVMAARALGVPSWRILWRHVLPHTRGLVVVQATLSIPGYIVAESGLSMLGLGVQDPYASWGNMLMDAMSVSAINQHPWILAPGAFLFAAVMGWNLVGDAVRDALDPRGRG